MSLLATTALALSAGVAYAEVSVSGDARMGLQYNSATPTAPAGKTTIENRMTVYFNGSVETTSGLSFGAQTGIRVNERGTGITTGARVYMKSGAVEVAVGNINGAIEYMPGVYSPSAGLTGLGWGGMVTNTGINSGVNSNYFNWDAYSDSGTGPQGVEVMYSAGSFSGHISYTDDGLRGGAGSDRVGAYGAYTMGDWTVAVGMQDSETASQDKTVVTVGGKVGDFGVGFAAADNNGVRKIALNGSATFGATKVSAYVADEEAATDNPIGLGVSYDLGGASLKGGVARTTTGDNRADMGVSFSF